MAFQLKPINIELYKLSYEDQMDSINVFLSLLKYDDNKNQHENYYNNIMLRLSLLNDYVTRFNMAAHKYRHNKLPKNREDNEEERAQYMKIEIYRHDLLYIIECKTFTLHPYANHNKISPITSRKN